MAGKPEKQIDGSRFWLVIAIAAFLCATVFLQRGSAKPGRVASTDISRIEPGDASMTNVRNVAMPDQPGARRIAERRVPAYDPAAPLAPQLQRLRNLSDSGDAYATCVLAWALDLCVRGGDRISVAEYGGADPEDLEERDVDRIAKSLEFSERHENSCAGLDGASFRDLDQRLLQAAQAGHVRSMARFALLPLRLGSGENASDPTFVLAHRTHAESMLNRAAEAGDMEAVRGVHQAYGLGYITSAMGTLVVERDLVKSTAALRAMARHAGPEDRSALEQNIASAMQGMGRADVARMERLEATYFHADRGGSGIWEDDQDVIEDLPEKVCADAAPRPG